MVRATRAKAYQDSDQSIQKDSDDGSDSAPEEVAFQDEEKSRQSQRQAAQQIKAQKELLKKKRKEIHDRNKEQKEEKRKRLEEKRLPSDVLENLCEPSSEPVLDTSVKPIRKVFSDTEECPDEDVKPQKDFISIHGPTVFKVKVLNEKTKSGIPESVANFKKNALQKVRREPTRQLIAKMEKQKVGQKNVYK